MSFQSAATLGVQLKLDSANFVTEADKAIRETARMQRSISTSMKAADKEIQSLKYAMEDYGKTVSKVTEVERALETGRLKNIKGTDKAKELLDQARAYDAIAMSAKNAAGAQFKMNEQQKMQMTYQTTDLFTQIASGQNPFIAIMQQGGQLKDSMGGIGNMFKALGTLITPVSVSLTALGTIVGVLAYAVYEADKEFDAFNNALTLTGNYAGMTASQLVDMSGALASSTKTTVGAATDVLEALVSSGKFTSKSLDSVATAILTYSKIAKVDGKAAAEALMSGLDGSASGAQRLNEKMHFLTLEQYKQIEAFEKAGKQQDGAAMASDILAKKLEAQKRLLGEMEGAWDKAKRAMSEYWASLKEAISGPSTAEGVLKKTIDEIEAIEFSLSKGMSGGERKAYEERLAKLQQQKQKFQELIKARDESVTPPEESQSTKDYAAAGGIEKAKQIAAATAKATASIKYTQALATASEEEKINAESEKQKSEKRAEFARKSEEEKRAFGKELGEQLSAELLDIEKNRLEKIRLLRQKEKIDTAKAVIAEEQALRDMNDEYAKTVANAEWSAREKTRTMEITQEELKLKNQIMFLSEKDQKLAENKFKYDRLREEAIGKAGEATIVENLNKQEKMDEMSIAIRESMLRTQQVFDTVWGNMSSAIDNFVKTGKLSFRDFAKSVIQDMLAMNMKLQAMAMLRMAFNMFSPAPASANPSQYSLDFSNARLGQPRAVGGPVSAGSPYMIGEKGPEMFIPSGSGTIIPNNQLAGMGGTTNVTNNYINAIDTKSFEDRLLGSSNAVWAANQYAGKNLATNFGRT
jgi:hypothetical protein